MSALAIKLYGIISNEKSVDINIDLSKIGFINIGGKRLVVIMENLYKRSFIYHFYKLLSSPVE